MDNVFFPVRVFSPNILKQTLIFEQISVKKLNHSYVRISGKKADKIIRVFVINMNNAVNPARHGVVSTLLQHPFNVQMLYRYCGIVKTHRQMQRFVSFVKERYLLGERSIITSHRGEGGSFVLFVTERDENEGGR